MIDGDELQISRRHLPHWTLKGATYFITFRTKKADLSVEEQKLVLKHIIDGGEKFYFLIATVVMPDHVHLLLTPRGEYNLSRIMKGIKGLSARKINLKRKETDRNGETDRNVCSAGIGIGTVWQEESFDRIVRDQDELNEKITYMMNNPVKNGLTNDPWDYHGWYFNGRTDIPVCPKDLGNKQAGMPVLPGCWRMGRTDIPVCLSKRPGE